MPERKIQENLEQLRKEIEQIADQQSPARTRLQGLVDEIESSIDSSNEEEDQGLMQNLREAVSHFETEHPRATAILNDIMVTLSNMGI